MEKSFSTERELATFLATEQDWMFNRIYEAIEEAFYHVQSEAEIFVAKIIEDDTLIDITSECNEWARSLGLCITYFESQEEYEKCYDAKLLLEDIKSKYPEDEQEEI